MILTPLDLEVRWTFDAIWKHVNMFCKSVAVAKPIWHFKMTAFYRRGVTVTLQRYVAPVIDLVAVIASVWADHAWSMTSLRRMETMNFNARGRAKNLGLAAQDSRLIMPKVCISNDSQNVIYRTVIIVSALSRLILLCLTKFQNVDPYF